MKSEFHEVLTAGDYCILYQSIEFTVAANGNQDVVHARNPRLVMSSS